MGGGKRAPQGPLTYLRRRLDAVFPQNIGDDVTGSGMAEIREGYCEFVVGDVLRFLSKKNAVWFPGFTTVPGMGTETENHTSWGKYYRVSDCSSSSRNDWFLGDESFRDRTFGSADDASVRTGA